MILQFSSRRQILRKAPGRSILRREVDSVGPGLWITSLNVKYRDFRYVIPFIVQFGLYVSPIGFSSSESTDFGGAFFEVRMNCVSLASWKQL